LGVKGENEARTFAFDAAVFHIDWKEIQLLADVNGININTNAGRAESEGVEVSMGFWPVERLKVSLAGAYTDAKLTEDADPVLVGGRDGDRLPYAPKTSYTAGADYNWPLAGNRRAYVGASFSHLSEVPAGFDPAFLAENGRQRFLPSYDTLDVRAGWEFGRVLLEVFGRNLTNDEGKTSDASGNTPFGALATGIIRPRSYGMTMTAEF
jgi:iron complex outermembrane receptor protein